MNTNHSPALRALWIAFLLWVVYEPLRAEQFGNFYYMVNGDTVAITGTTENTMGAVTIPASIGGRRVTEVGGFTNRRGLTSVTIPEGVTTLSWGAFQSCVGLTSITIPESVTSIDGFAFAGCNGLTSISIPAGVTSIGDSAFAECRSMTAIEVSPLNPNYSGLDGVLFNKSRTTLVQFPRGKTGFYAIPGSVTSVGAAAFQYGGGLTSVFIPESVTDIGIGAFNDCVGLTSVSIPGNVTSIGSQAFSGCTGLISVSIPGSVTTIGTGAFGGCASLTAFEVEPLNPNYSSLDGALMDKNRTSLIQFPAGRTGAWTIPNSMTEIPAGAFAGCEGLTSVSIPGTVTSIGDSAFWGCSGLTSISIPDSITSIGGSAFAICTGLTSISIPDSITSIGSSAFEGCTGLTSVSIGSNVTGIPSSSFKDCTGLTTITIPIGVTRIDWNAFEGCTGLTSVVIPDSVTRIESSAFQNCTSLTSVTIPDSVTYLGHYAFTGCTGLASVMIGREVTFIGWSAFEGCASLTSVAIPDSVTMIGDLAFKGCTGLTSVTIGNSVTEIGWFAFLGCTGLTAVSIPPSVTVMDVGPFDGCAGMTAIEVSPQNPNYSSLDGVLFNKGRTRLLRFPSLRGGAYSVPNTVLEISGRAFERCATLTLVSVPGSVTSVGAGSFLDCPALTRIDVDTTNPAYSSLDGVLFNKNRTALVRYPTGKTGAYSIPAGVTSIDNGTFLGCAGLTSISMPDSVTTIGQRAFEDCPGLTSVSFSNSITSIGAYAFEDCTGLTSVSIPNSVTRIDYAAFRRCTGLTSISIGRGVTFIVGEAFSGCAALSGFAVDALNTTFRSIDGVLFGRSPFKLHQVPARKAGHYSIPSGVIGRFPDEPFDQCAALTSVSIPASFTDHLAFPGCLKLTAINVDPQNQHFSSLDGVLYDKFGIFLLRFPAGRSGSYIIPAKVINIETYAFESCTGLHSLLFAGDNPGPDPITFADTAPGFTLYYFRGSLWFTSPTWLGYPSVMIDRAVHPAAGWLFGYGLPYNADLQDDPNGDGVSLLMAYALNLDPNLNLRSSLPVPLLGPQDLSLSFQGATPGITYEAETSTDLLNWTTVGLILSAPGPDGRRTASIARDGPARYLRLTVAD